MKVQIPLPENANCYSELSIAHYLGNNEYEYFVFDKEGKVGNMWVEELGGEEYLTFETASFSPFNVGGHQIVLTGTSSNNHKPSAGSGSQGNRQRFQAFRKFGKRYRADKPESEKTVFRNWKYGRKAEPDISVKEKQYQDYLYRKNR